MKLRKAVRIEKTKNSLLGGYTDNKGLVHLNKYDWKCTICNKIYPQRSPAINCCKKEKKILEKYKYKIKIKFINKHHKNCECNTDNPQYWIKHIKKHGGKIISIEEIKKEKKELDYNLLREMF